MKAYLKLLFKLISEIYMLKIVPQDLFDTHAAFLQMCAIDE